MARLSSKISTWCCRDDQKLRPDMETIFDLIHEEKKKRGRIPNPRIFEVTTSGSTAMLTEKS